ncbi:hypothetical protein D3C74_50310 [compost metagenome]
MRDYEVLLHKRLSKKKISATAHGRLLDILRLWQLMALYSSTEDNFWLDDDEQDFD